MNDPQLVAEFEAMARDLEDWANDPAGRTTGKPGATLTIVYRDPRRPEKTAMTLIADQANAAAMIDQLENRSFVVDKITYDPFATAVPLSDAAE